MSFTGESSSPLKSKTAKGRCNDETGGFEGESGNSFGQMNGNSSEESIAVLESMAVTPKVRNKSWGRIASPLKSSEFNVEMGVKNSHTPRHFMKCLHAVSKAKMKILIFCRGSQKLGFLCSV